MLLEGFEEENPLPRSIEVYLEPERRNPEAIGPLVAELRTLEGIERVSYERRQLELLQRIRTVVYAIGGLIVVIAVVVVALSIMLTIYARREELMILQLVGATYAFIRVPLLLQGCVQGLLGCAAGLGISYLFYHLYGATLGLSLFLTPEQSAGMLTGATLVGTVGGMIPLRRRIRFLGGLKALGGCVRCSL
ncbi:MAG: hypothetical protein KatS3mg115_0276 [Candidatus Poribacteria bacterium]|nr:MAG: hypothetical protein KatS3mg115_0276 [Candidatus Poribacteria bacterium]